VDADADLDVDGVVGLGDLAILKRNFGRTDASVADGDLDRDGAVTRRDLMLFSQQYGRRTSLPAVNSPQPNDRPRLMLSASRRVNGAVTDRAVSEIYQADQPLMACAIRRVRL
jgi:hypothetical protein